MWFRFWLTGHPFHLKGSRVRWCYFCAGWGADLAGGSECPFCYGQGLQSRVPKMFKFGWFSSHTKFQLPWKIDCDFLSDSDWKELAKIVAWKFAFSEVHGVPRGGIKFAQALQSHVEPASGYPTIIVDDVLTTGRSMIEFRDKLLLDNPNKPILGIVLFARCPKDNAAISVPDWVFPIMTVSEWAQSRATGLG